MKNVMDYDSIDWNAEAKRIARAFGVSEDCEFESGEHPYEMWLEPLDRKQELLLAQGYLLTVLYEKSGMYFEISKQKKLGYLNLVSSERTSITLDSSGRPVEITDPLNEATILAKALLYLGLLSLEVEAALGVHISAHQKIEWELENETS